MSSISAVGTQTRRTFPSNGGRSWKRRKCALKCVPGQDCDGCGLRGLSCDGVSRRPDTYSTFFLPSSAGQLSSMSDRVSTRHEVSRALSIYVCTAHRSSAYGRCINAMSCLVCAIQCCRAFKCAARCYSIEALSPSFVTAIKTLTSQKPIGTIHHLSLQGLSLQRIILVSTGGLPELDA